MRGKCFLVNGFAQIGWTDPFADEAPQAAVSPTQVPADGDQAGQPRDDAETRHHGAQPSVRVPTMPDELAYHESRYIPGFSPYVTYVPSKEVMFKLMRACIGVTDAEDLWINGKGF